MFLPHFTNPCMSPIKSKLLSMFYQILPSWILLIFSLVSFSSLSILFIPNPRNAILCSRHVNLQLVLVSVLPHTYVNAAYSMAPFLHPSLMVSLLIPWCPLGLGLDSNVNQSNTFPDQLYTLSCGNTRQLSFLSLPSYPALASITALTRVYFYFLFTCLHTSLNFRVFEFLNYLIHHSVFRSLNSP